MPAPEPVSKDADMTITLYNTRTRRKDPFAPLDPDNVRMYVCGPTVYDRHTYGADHVTYVRNFTDVDDKINARAAETGRSIGEITAETAQWFLDDMAAVGALEPSLQGRDSDRAMPRATQYIAQMVAMIEDLIAKGHAYEAEGHVLFAVESYAKVHHLVSTVRRRLWRALRALGRGYDRGRARRGRPLQAQPDGFRAVEAVGR